MKLSEAKVALVFDWMTSKGGAERVNLALAEIFPNAPIFTSIYNEKNFPQILGRTTASFINALPFSKKRHQYFLSLMPYAYENFDLSEFDIVISSSHSCAKGIITKPDTVHICYCHSPMRYCWDNWQQYVRDYKIGFLAKLYAKFALHGLRIWDKLSADRVDYFIANSATTKKRIEKYYRRDSEVIFPSIKSKKYAISDQKKEYFLAIGRLIPYKKFDLIVEAFNELNLPLKIVGTGISEKELRAKANSNIEFLGFVDEKRLRNLYSNCEALIFPQVEDFGLTVLEAMASGRPVIAYNEGGAKDTVIEGKTGIFFKRQDKHHLISAVNEYLEKKKNFRPTLIKKHAENFDQKIFKEKMIEVLEKALNACK